MSDPSAKKEKKKKGGLKASKADQPPEDDVPPAPPMLSANVGASSSSAPTDLDELLDEMAPELEAPAPAPKAAPKASPKAQDVPQDIASAPAKKKAAQPPQSDEDDAPAPPLILSASVGSTDMPPKSPPPIDDMFPSAQPPEARQPGSASKDAGKKLADKEVSSVKQPNISSQISKEEEELGDVLKATAPPLAPAQAYVAPLPPPAKPPPAALDPVALSQQAAAPSSPSSPAEGKTLLSQNSESTPPSVSPTGNDLPKALPNNSSERTSLTAGGAPNTSASMASMQPIPSTSIMSSFSSLFGKGSEVVQPGVASSSSVSSMVCHNAFDNPDGGNKVQGAPDEVGLRPVGLPPKGQENVLVRLLSWRPLVVESDFSAFIRAVGTQMRQQDAYREALAMKRKKQSGRRLQETFEGLQWRQRGLVDVEGDEDIESGEKLRLRPLTINDVEVQSQEDLEWLEDFHERDNGRLLQSSSGTVALLRTLTLTYMPDDKNAFDSRLLRGVRDFEAGLRSKKSWQDMCGKVSTNTRMLCDPGESFIAFAYPSRTAPNASEATEANSTRFKFSFDALGPDELQIPAALSILQHGTSSILQNLFPKDYVAPVVGSDMSSATAPSGLRTRYSFYVAVGRSGGPVAELRKATSAASAAYEEFITEEIFPAVMDKQIGGTDDDDKYAGCRVLYSGDVISGYEVSRTLRLDAQFAIGAMAFVTFYLWLHTGSLILASCSLGVILTAVPLAYVLTPASKTTVASFLSLFLVTGIGCDVVFVFTDCWDQSLIVEKTRSRRIAWMLLHAGRNCLATSLTTAASFFANLASALQPLREFGLFMGLAVFGAFVLVALFLPPLIVLRENCCRGGGELAQDDQGEIGSTAIVPVGQPSSPISAQGRDAKKPSRMKRVLMWEMDKVAACPRVIVFISIISVLVFLIGVVTTAQLDNEVPDIFPADHNQIREAKAQEMFAVMQHLKSAVPEAENGPACTPNAEWWNLASITKSRCVLHWCDAPWSMHGLYTTTTSPPANTSTTSDSVTCWWNKAPPKCRSVEFRTRLATTGGTPTSTSWKAAVADAVKTGSNATSVLYTSTPQELHTLVLEDWETGRMETRRFHSMGTVYATYSHHAVVPVTARASCVVDQICYQGETRCDHPGWANTSLSNVVFTKRRLLQRSAANQDVVVAPEDGQLLTGLGAAPDARLTSLLPTVGRRLATATVPRNKRVDVTVVWGIRPARSTPTVGEPSEVWSFDPTFEPDNPWAQRAIHAMCDQSNLGAGLLILEKRCWIDSFKEYLTKTRKKRFPTRDFENEVNIWFPTTIKSAEDLWRDGKRVQAMKTSFILNLALDIAAQPLLDHRKLWDDYIETMNSAASVTASRAYHTAAAWVRAEAEIAVVDSTVDTIIVSAVSAWLGMALFTQDPVLSSLVLVLVLGIILGLAFFICILVGWKFGSIEVISLVIFVGYSVTYSLHVAHSYAEARMYRDTSSSQDIEAPLAFPPPGPEASEGRPMPTKEEIRRHRTKLAIVHIGAAVLSSAISTLGSSAFLLCCTMIIFVKLGSVVIAVTVLSIICALVLLPALLMIIGPPEEPFHRRCLERLKRIRKRLKRA